MTQTAELSVVIPTLDEAECLPALLADLAAQRAVTAEVIVADGGSADATRAVAAAGGARCIETPAAGRAHQMNAGAAAARAPWLLFLHADTRLNHPRQLRDALDCLAAAATADARVVGHFALRFGPSVPAPAWLFRFMAAKTATGRRYTINGDQGLLVASDWFDALGGFDAVLPFLEDQRFAAALTAAGGHFRLLPHGLTTSPRRFETEGAIRRYALMGLIMAMNGSEVSCFFEHAPAVYVRQSRAGRLSLAPYLGVLGRLAADAGWPASKAATARVAAFTVSQFWQLPFAWDVARSGQVHEVDARATRAYERHWARWIEARPTRRAIQLGLLALLAVPAAAAWPDRIRRRTGDAGRAGD